MNKPSNMEIFKAPFGPPRNGSATKTRSGGQAAVSKPTNGFKAPG